MKYQSQWCQLQESSVSRGFNTIRISEECDLDLFLAVDSEKRRSLILALPVGYAPELKALARSNLQLKFHTESALLAMTLLDVEYISLFDDLITSLYHSIKHKTSASDAASSFIEQYIKWDAFFAKKAEVFLSKDSILGLWGEMRLLLKLLNEVSSSESMTLMLESWRGPFGDKHDFQFERKSIEVKTKLKSSATISISSEYQLEQVSEKTLELCVITVEEDVNQGISICQLFEKIKLRLGEKYCDVFPFLIALNQLNLNTDNIKQYRGWKFKFHVAETYDPLDIDFPKITSEKLNEAISGVCYKLNPTLLKPFCLSEEIF